MVRGDAEEEGWRTDPLAPDTDGIRDGEDVAQGSDPRMAGCSCEAGGSAHGSAWLGLLLLVGRRRR